MLYRLSHLNHDPYTVEVTNRFKGPDQFFRVCEELWTEVCSTVQGAVTKTIPNKKKTQEGKMVGEALQIAEERRKMKGKGERERYT